MTVSALWAHEEIHFIGCSMFPKFLVTEMFETGRIGTFVATEPSYPMNGLFSPFLSGNEWPPLSE